MDAGCISGAYFNRIHIPTHVEKSVLHFYFCLFLSIPSPTRPVSPPSISHDLFSSLVSNTFCLFLSVSCLITLPPSLSILTMTSLSLSLSAVCISVSLPVRSGLFLQWIFALISYHRSTSCLLTQTHTQKHTLALCWDM